MIVWSDHKTNEEEIDIDDYPIGLPNGVPKPPMEYHLGLINKYLRENNKSVHELTREELEMFRHEKPTPLW